MLTTKMATRPTNAADNLEWATRGENNFHKARVLGKHIGVNHPFYGKVGSLSLSSKLFRFRSPDGEMVEFMGLNEFCRKRGLSASAMSRVSKGAAPHHKGWTWDEAFA